MTEFHRLELWQAENRLLRDRLDTSFGRTSNSERVRRELREADREIKADQG